MLIKLTVFLNIYISDLNHIAVLEKTVPPIYLPLSMEDKGEEYR